MQKITIFFLTLLLILIAFIIIRFLSSTELDDVTPAIPCEQSLLDKSDVLWIIPKFNNDSIENHPDWCSQIKSLNKTLGLHGVYHPYKEFAEEKNQAYLEEGINAFEKCFGFKPEQFKPPQLAISKENKPLIKNNNLKLKTLFNQLTHKVYHCNNSGKFPNWFIDLI